LEKKKLFGSRDRTHGKNFSSRANGSIMTSPPEKDEQARRSSGEEKEGINTRERDTREHYHALRPARFVRDQQWPVQARLRTTIRSAGGKKTAGKASRDERPSIPTSGSEKMCSTEKKKKSAGGRREKERSRTRKKTLSSVASQI